MTDKVQMGITEETAMDMGAEAEVAEKAVEVADTTIEEIAIDMRPKPQMEQEL